MGTLRREGYAVCTIQLQTACYTVSIADTQGAQKHKPWSKVCSVTHQLGLSITTCKAESPGLILSQPQRQESLALHRNWGSCKVYSLASVSFSLPVVCTPGHVAHRTAKWVVTGVAPLARAHSTARQKPSLQSEGPSLALLDAPHVHSATLSPQDMAQAAEDLLEPAA